MRLVNISDTHGHQDKLEMPEGDVLIHAGDFTYFGSNKKQYQTFAKWFLGQPHKYKIFIAGNHELKFDENKSQALSWFRSLPGWNDNTYYLQNSGVLIEGLYFYGAPQQPIFGDLAFNADYDELVKVWARIPTNTNVLITHGPPRGILDHGHGCIALADRVKNLPVLQAHIFGHIHEGFGVQGPKPLFINAAMAEGNFHSIANRKPIIIEVNLTT
jgi:Icc-related predicted phosphoesterase